MSEERPKHTPGPWHFPKETGCRSVYSTTNGNEICDTVGLYDDDEDEANALLIAASPDMYEALKARIQADAHPSTCNLCQPSNPCRQYYIESGNANLKMYKARAKAEGKTG